MSKDQELTNLEQLLDRIDEAAPDGDQVSLGAILDMVGRRSFGPLLLVAGMVTLALLIGDIPGMPTIMGVLVMLIAGQLLGARDVDRGAVAVSSGTPLAAALAAQAIRGARQAPQGAQVAAPPGAIR